MIIRKETAGDFAVICHLVKTAFETADYADGDEQDFVNQLREGTEYIPDLALVAEENGRIVGHIMLTRTYVTGAHGRFEALQLAPLSVALEHRRKGIGTALINEGFRVARQMGYSAVFLIGDPAYY